MSEAEDICRSKMVDRKLNPTGYEELNKLRRVVDDLYKQLDALTKERDTLREALNEAIPFTHYGYKSSMDMRNKWRTAIQEIDK